MRTRFVQIKNPRSGLWVLVDRLHGSVVDYQVGQYNGVEIRDKKTY